MNCKFCNAEVGEEYEVCPICGKALTAEEPAVQEIADAAEEAIIEETVYEEPVAAGEPVAAEEPIAAEEPVVEELIAAEEAVVAEEPAQKPKKKVWSLVLAIAGAVVALGVLAVVLLYAMGVDLIPRANDIYKKDSYTVEDDVAGKKGSKVVAQIGSKELTNGQLQIYYKEVVYDFINNNYYYLSTLGMDTATPLSQQTCYVDENLTWEQYFLEDALGVWQRYATLQILAEEANYQVEENMQAFFDDIPTALSEAATSAGFESVDAWILENYGPGVTQEDITEYMRTYYIGSAYLQSRYGELMPTDEEIDTYFAENEAVFAENGITKDSGDYYDVRHILVAVEGGTTDEDGVTTYSDAEWEACRVKAQELYDQWKEGEATEDSFAELANTNSTDTGSNTNGGLYSQLTADTNFVEEFKQWYLDENRKPGDTGLVKTTYGYHIMYFSGSESIWYYNASTQLLSERITKLIDDGMERFPMKTAYGRIVLADLGLSE